MNDKVKYLTRLALFSALIALLAFTPLGYLRAGAVEITFIIIPVSVGAMILGPAGGAILGGVFGVTSFLQCFGMSTFGTMLFGVDAVSTVVLCLIPRILCGWFTGLIFRLLIKRREKKIVPFIVGGLCTPIFNTLLFVGGFMLLFRNTMLDMMTEGGLTLLPFLAGFVGINGLIEAGVSFAVSVPIAKALAHFIRNSVKQPF